jgi:hypothetical protein
MIEGTYNEIRNVCPKLEKNVRIKPKNNMDLFSLIKLKKLIA